MKVEEYIGEKMPLTIRRNKNDEGTLIGLPYPYTVPCAEAHFNELYYWDTYFTNKALFALGNIEQAKNNVKNILYLIERFSHMPNGNRTYYLKRSQPPYAALMADDIYRRTGDIAFLRDAFHTLKKEYDFWMTKRLAPNGLNRYGSEDSAEECAAFYNDCVVSRLGANAERVPEEAGGHYLAEAESGWDFSPRFGGYCLDCNPVDLNSNLYLYETLFAEYEVLLKEGSGTEWKKRAAARKDKINSLLWDKQDKLYKDYNYKTQAFSECVSAASFQPFFAEIAKEEQREGLSGLLKKLEGEYGLFVTERGANKFQWAYPNVWAPCQLVAIRALEQYGYHGEAKRIAEKYSLLIEKNFERHGKLFEKYNGLSGDIDAVAEYGTPEMLGWTAGVYMECKKYN